jgi:hypothetical protein
MIETTKSVPILTGTLRELCMRIRHAVGLASVVSGVLYGVAPVVAATVTDINSTITNAGSCTLANTCPESYAAATYPGSITQVMNVPPAASFGFTNSFNQGSNTSTGSNLGASATGSGAPWNFQDNILFTTNGAAVQAQAIAQLTNVSDLQVRIIALKNPATGTSFDVTSAASASALLGGPSVVTIENGWTTFLAPLSGVNYTATMLNTIASGNYILQVRGEAASGSSYSGTVTFTPVPLPANLTLLLSGLGLLGVTLTRGRRDTIGSATAG